MTGELEFTILYLSINQDYNYKNNSSAHQICYRAKAHDEVNNKIGVRINKKYMTHQNLEKSLKKELYLLNDIIDRKIVRGLAYSKEAKKHKFILTKLSNLRRDRMNWMLRPFASLSLI